MKACFLSFSVAMVVLALFICSAWSDPIAIDLVTVGNEGNTGEECGDPVGPARISGAVDYEYQIGKYEVTAAQYTAFLNAVAATDTFGLYDAEMVNDSKGCQIQQSGADGSFSYIVATLFADRPANYVSFWDACRFANWLHNGQPSGVQDATTTEDGAYTMTTQGMTDNTIARNTGATWAVTSEDEWYKAAYHKNDGVTGNYWDYPTGSDTPPGSDMDDVSGNNGNFKDGIAPYPIDTDVFTTVAGEFQNSPSPYGTFDQGGNVWEWTESIMPKYNDPNELLYRELVGGAFEYDSSYAQADYRIYDSPDNGSDKGGFRVLSLVVDEPFPGDADGDGNVDVTDLGILATHYGTIGGAEWGDGDFSGDGNVDVTDLGILATNYGTIAAQAVPEPSTLSLLLLATLMLAWRRRR